MGNRPRGLPKTCRRLNAFPLSWPHASRAGSASLFEQPFEPRVVRGGLDADGGHLFAHVAEIGADIAQEPAEALGYKTAGMFFQPPDRVAAMHAEATPAASVDPTLLATHAQIALQREVAQAGIQIKRDKALADMAIAVFKARQWAEIERFRAGLTATPGAVA
jgi:hypothetical protein